MESPETLAKRIEHECGISDPKGSPWLVALIRARDAALLKPFEELAERLEALIQDTKADARVGDLYRHYTDRVKSEFFATGQAYAYGVAIESLRALLPKPEFERGQTKKPKPEGT